MKVIANIYQLVECKQFHIVHQANFYYLFYVGKLYVVRAYVLARYIRIHKVRMKRNCR